MNYRDEAEKLVDELDNNGIAVEFDDDCVTVTGDYGRDDEVQIPTFNISQTYLILKALKSAHDTGFENGQEAD